MCWFICELFCVWNLVCSSARRRVLTLISYSVITGHIHFINMSLRSISFNTVSWFNNAFKVSHSLCAGLETFTLNTCSAISLPLYTGRRPGQKLFMGWGQGASWVHTDECRICSSSCFHNEVKGNMKCSEGSATPSALWSRTSSRSCAVRVWASYWARRLPFPSPLDF